MKTSLQFRANKFSFVLIIFCGIIPAIGFSQNWTGNVDSDWNNPANWVTMPVNNATITINPSNYTGAAASPSIGVSSSFSPNKISIVNGAHLTVSEDLTINKDLIVDLGGQLTLISGTINVTQNMIIGDGFSSTPSKLNLNGALLNVGGNISFRNDAGNYIPTLTVNSGSLTVNGNATWFGQSPGSGTPKLNINGGQTTINGNIMNMPASTVKLYIAIKGGNFSFSGDSIKTLNMTDSINQFYPATFTLSDTAKWMNEGVFYSDSATTTINSLVKLYGNGLFDFHTLKINSSKTLDFISPTFINIKGNFINDGTYKSYTNSTIFVGNQEQFIGGTTQTQFGAFILNNSSTQGVTLNQSVSIKETLGLVAGNVNTTQTNLLIILDNAFANTSNSSSFVNGPVKKIGNDVFEFPIGKNNSWGRLHMSAPTSVTSEFTAEYFDTPYTNTTSVNSPLTNVSPVEHWTLTQANSTDMVNVSLYWDDASASNIYDCSVLSIARWNGADWDNVPATITGNCNGTASGIAESDDQQSDYGVFTFGNLDITTGIYHKTSVSGIQVFPNPNNGKATITLKDNFINSSFKLMDVSGKVILENNITTEKQEIDYSSQPSGVYYLVVNANGSVSRLKIVKI